MKNQILLSEIAYVASQSNADAIDWLRLIDTAINTITEGILIAGQNGNFAETMICDDEWNEFPLAIIASSNTDIIPHLVEIDGEIYNADFAVRVLACYIASSDHVRETQEILARVS